MICSKLDLHWFYILLFIFARSQNFLLDEAQLVEWWAVIQEDVDVVEDRISNGGVLDDFYLRY